MKSFDRTSGLVSILTLVLSLGSAPKGKLSAADTSLSSSDRRELTKLLGKGVVGKPVTGKPLTHSPAWMGSGTGPWVYRYTAGKKKGETTTYALRPIVGDTTGSQWRLEVRDKTYSFHQRSDGLHLVSTHDHEEGRLMRYSPPEPALFHDLKPGLQRSIEIDVSVSLLSDPDKVKYDGHLDLTYSYIGAFEVTVPAGTFEASLIKWDYQGKVGPAKIKDQQFRFVSEEVGMVAEVHKADISALLVYKDRSRDAMVLERKGND